MSKRFLKSSRPSLLIKRAALGNFESELSLYSLASLFPIKEGIFSNPSVSLSKGSSTSNQAFLLRRKDVNRPTRCSEPLRSKVGGPSKVFAILCGMGPPGCYGDQLAIILLKVSAWRGLTDWDHHFCSSLQYRSALVVARMRNIQDVTASVYGMTAWPMFKLQHISSYATFIGLKYSTTQQEYKRVKKNS